MKVFMYNKYIVHCKGGIVNVATKDVNFRLDVELNELLTDVAQLLQLPKVQLFNDSIRYYLKLKIKENKLDEDLKMLKEMRERRKKK
jgi:energy-coupling factor transporter ATP-binding protein EcfA2